MPKRYTTHLTKRTAGALIGALLATCAVSAGAAPMATLEEAKAQAKWHLNMMVFGVRMFHHDAKGSIGSTIKLPQFEEYFALPESSDNRYDALGRIQLTENQVRIRKEIERWTLNLHARFPIAESCLIDQSGQEHMRVTGEKIEDSIHFSSEEQGAVFFNAGFTLSRGEVHISKPYMSMDAFEWVVAIATPVVMRDGSKPGIFHFEIPLATYGRMVASDHYNFDAAETPVADLDDEGRYLIVDEQGLLIADSRQEVRYTLIDERNPDLNPDLPDYLPEERLADYLPDIMSLSDAPAFHDAVAQMRQMERGLLDLEIDGQTYVFAFESLQDQPWYVIHFDPVDGPAFWSRN